MEQLAIVASLKPGMEEEARKLIAQGPPFDIGESGLERHTVYLSAREVVFVFEGQRGGVDRRLHDRGPLPAGALRCFRELASPRRARAADRAPRFLLATS